jgi:hypothetical protein
MKKGGGMGWVWAWLAKPGFAGSGCYADGGGASSRDGWVKAGKRAGRRTVLGLLKTRVGDPSFLRENVATKPYWAVRLEEKQGCSFLKKRTKKLLYFGVLSPASVHTNEQKSFASFLQKRRPFCLP